MEKRSVTLKWVAVAFLAMTLVSIGMGFLQHENIPLFLGGFFAFCTLVISLRLKRIESEEQTAESVAVDELTPLPEE